MTAALADRTRGVVLCSGVVYALTPSRSVEGLWHVWRGEGARRRSFGCVSRASVLLSQRVPPAQQRLDVATLRAIQRAWFADDDRAAAAGQVPS